MDPAKISLPRLDVSALMRAHNLAPKKGLGQNFLIDEPALRQIVAAADLAPTDTVLEIGPGLGHLTRYLARCAGRVEAVELDRNLIPVLGEVLADFPNVTIRQGDILELDLASLGLPVGFKVVANIPYHITGAIMEYLLEAKVKPALMVLTVQKEVAEAICAGPGEMSIRALSVQVYGQPRVAARIPAGAFFPPPDVDSAVLRIDLYPQPRIPAPRLKYFFRLVKAGFSQKRKTLRNSLSAGLAIKPEQAVSLLQAAGIDPQRRAETLSIEEWGMIVDKL